MAKEKKDTNDILKNDNNQNPKNTTPKSWILLIILSLSLAALVPYAIK
jgi:hypothetical protein